MPPTDVILSDGRVLSAGVLAAVTGPSVVTTEPTGLLDPVKVLVTASMRTRPLACWAEQLSANFTALMVPVPVTTGATNRIAPPLPDAPLQRPPTPAAPSPPFAVTVPLTRILVEDAMTTAPPPPPPPPPVTMGDPEVVVVAPPPPPDPPMSGTRLTKPAEAP